MRKVCAIVLVMLCGVFGGVRVRANNVVSNFLQPIAMVAQAAAGGMPVIDLSSIKQICDQLVKTNNNWFQLIGGKTKSVGGSNESEGLMGKFIAKFAKIINASDQTGAAMGDEQMKIIDPTDIQKYLDGAFFRDVQGVDIWKDILSSQTKLVQQYSGLEYQDLHVLTDQQSDPELVEYMEENSRVEKEMLQNMQNMADFIASMRKWELERAEKLKQYSDLIKKFAKGNEQYGEVSNLEALGNAIRIEIIKADQQLLAVNRVMMESELKEKVVKLDMEKRYQRMKDSIQARNQLKRTDNEE